MASEGLEMRTSSLWLLCLTACATAEVKKQVPPPALPDQDLYNHAWFFAATAGVRVDLAALFGG